MKLNIEKFAAGGYFSAIPNPYAQGQQQEETTSKGTSSKKEDDELVPKAILNKLVEEGLPNEVELFTRELAEFAQYTDMYGLDKSRLYHLIGKANTIIKNGDFLKKAEEKAYQNSSIDEIAISAKSEMFVIDQDQNIKKVHISKFNAKKQHALTIGELLEYRKYAPELSYNTEIATVTGNSIGLEKIESYIKSIIDTVGTSKTTVEAYENLASLIGKDAKQLSAGQLEAITNISQLMHQEGPDAIFQVKDMKSSKNMQAAFKYILNILPSNMKNQLLANSVAQGATYQQASSQAIDTILSALEMADSPQHDYTLKYDQQINKAAKTSATADDDTRRQTTTEMFFNQNLNRSPITISDARYKNQLGLVAQGSIIPSLTIDGGTGVGSGPLLEQLEANGKGMGKYLDMNKVWMGYDHVSPESLSKVLYQGDQVANVWLPTNSEGEIDWESVTNYAEAEEEIKLQNITDPAEKNQIHAKHGSPVQYDAQGNIVKNSNVGNFMMIHGYTVDDLLSSDNLFYREVDSDREKLLTEQIKSINKANKNGIAIDTPGWFDQYVEVPIFIKIQPNAGTNAAYYARQGSLVPEMSLQDDMTQQMLQQQPQMQIYGSAAALYGQQ